MVIVWVVKGFAFLSVVCLIVAMAAEVTTLIGCVPADYRLDRPTANILVPNPLFGCLMVNAAISRPSDQQHRSPTR